MPTIHPTIVTSLYPPSNSVIGILWALVLQNFKDSSVLTAEWIRFAVLGKVPQLSYFSWQPLPTLMSIPVLCPPPHIEIPLLPFPIWDHCGASVYPHLQKNSGCKDKGFYVRIVLPPPSSGMPSEKHILNSFFGNISIFH